MKDMQACLERLLAQSAECELIRDLATNPQKRELFDRLARHHRELATQIELAIASEPNNHVLRPENAAAPLSNEGEQRNGGSATKAGDLMRINASMQMLLNNCKMEWQPITSAPFGVDLEVAVIDGEEIYTLIFPCRRDVRGWLNDSGASVQIHPTHWRQWE